MAGNDSTFPPPPPQAQAMAVGCGCFGRPSGGGNLSAVAKARSADSFAEEGAVGRSAARSASVKPRSIRKSTVIYHAAGVGYGSGSDGNVPVLMEKGDIDLVFFDAVDTELEEDEYPIITTSFIPKAKKVSFMDPSSMLRDSKAFSDWGSQRFEDARMDPTEEGDIDSDGRLKDGVEIEPEIPASAPPPPPDSPIRSPSSVKTGTPSSFRTRSFKILRRGSVAARKDLEEPTIRVEERGYPGQLTAEELIQCQMFYREIHKRKGHYLEIVYSLHGIEEEPYAICRYMRATKFDSSKILERLEQGQSMWEEAKKNNFYKDIDAALGAPLVLFLQHYPYFYYGNAKNGCPINYFKAGELKTEALLALVSPEVNARYFWNSFMYTFREKMITAKQRNPDFVRCESINVLDLKGLSSGQLTNEAFDCLKSVSAISNFFPETLHCMVILNAPSWFAFTWTVIKSFIDPRTAKKIEVYATEEKGNKRLSELVETMEIPCDFGGKAPSLEETIRENCRKPDGTEYYSTLVHVKKTGNKVADLITLRTGEMAKVRVYSRSVTGATVTVSASGKVVVTQTISKLVPQSAELQPPPKCTEIAQDIQGPGKVTVEVKGLNDANPGKLSCGYFLLAVEVGKVSV